MGSIPKISGRILEILWMVKFWPTLETIQCKNGIVMAASIYNYINITKIIHFS